MAGGRQCGIRDLPAGGEISGRQTRRGANHATRMKELSHLFAQNRDWADSIRKRDPEFFLKLSRQQSPEFLWIGCSE